MANSILDKKSVCIVTGASRGLGRSIAIHFSKALPKQSVVILLSRNEEKMKEVAEIIEQNGNHAAIVKFDQGSRDQSDFDNIIIVDILSKAGISTLSEFEQAILVNNAGSLEHTDFVRNLDKIGAAADYFQNNLVGCLAITSKFLQVFSQISKVVINISSLAAIAPMKSWSLYCMGKAARDMMMKVIGSEEENIRTLNYAPGPLATDMSNIACQDTKDPELKKWFQEQISNKSLLECDVSVKKLMDVLEKNSFENGAHVDYYDEL